MNGVKKRVIAMPLHDSGYGRIIFDSVSACARRFGTLRAHVETWIELGILRSGYYFDWALEETEQ